MKVTFVNHGVTRYDWYNTRSLGNTVLELDFVTIFFRRFFYPSSIFFHWFSIWGVILDREIDSRFFFIFPVGSTGVILWNADFSFSVPWVRRSTTASTFASTAAFFSWKNRRPDSAVTRPPGPWAIHQNTCVTYVYKLLLFIIRVLTLPAITKWGKHLLNY